MNLFAFDLSFSDISHSAMWIVMLVLCYGLAIRFAKWTNQHILAHPILTTTTLLLTLTQLIEPDVGQVMTHLHPISSYKLSFFIVFICAALSHEKGLSFPFIPTFSIAPIVVVFNLKTTVLRCVFCTQLVKNINTKNAIMVVVVFIIMIFCM